MSIDVKMAWRNIWRHPRRTMLTITAIAFACTLLVFMLSWAFSNYETMINASVKMQTGHLQVQAKAYNEKRNMNLVVENPVVVGDLLKKNLEVQAYTFRGNAFSLVSSKKRTYGVLVVGIDPAREARVSTLKSLIRQGNYLSEGDYNHALIGKLLAKNLQVEIGNELTILGQGRDGSIAATVVIVKGIYGSGIDVFDRSSIQIPLKTFQEVYSMEEAVHEVAVISKSLGMVDDLQEIVQANINKLKQKYPLVALDWGELNPGLRQSIELDLASGVIFYMILVLVVAFSILNTFLMAIFERTKEFGVFMAMGTSPRRLIKMLLFESTFMTLLGVIFGMALGASITFYFQTYGFSISGTSELLRQFGMPERMYPQLSILSLLIGPSLVLVITFLSALYPAMKIRKLKPVEALTYI